MIANLLREVREYKKERDTLIDDIKKLRKERDRLIKCTEDVRRKYSNALSEYNEIAITNFGIRAGQDILSNRLDDVVELFNTHLAYKKAWSDNPYYDRLQTELNKIVDGYPVGTTRLRRLYSTEIEQALKNKDLDECLFLLEKIKMDLEGDE